MKNKLLLLLSFTFFTLVIGGGACPQDDAATPTPAGGGGGGGNPPPPGTPPAPPPPPPVETAGWVLGDDEVIRAVFLARANSMEDFATDASAVTKAKKDRFSALKKDCGTYAAKGTVHKMTLAKELHEIDKMFRGSALAGAPEITTASEINEINAFLNYIEDNWDTLTTGTSTLSLEHFQKAFGKKIAKKENLAPVGDEGGAVNPLSMIFNGVHSLDDLKKFVKGSHQFQGNAFDINKVDLADVVKMFGIGIIHVNDVVLETMDPKKDIASVVPEKAWKNSYIGLVKREGKYQILRFAFPVQDGKPAIDIFAAKDIHPQQEIEALLQAAEKLVTIVPPPGGDKPPPVGSEPPKDGEAAAGDA